MRRIKYDKERFSIDMDRFFKTCGAANQEELGRMFGVSQNTIHCWLTAATFPTRDNWAAIERVSGLKPSEYRIAPTLTDYAMDALAKRLEARETITTILTAGDNSTNTPVISQHNTESPVSVKVTHNNGTAPPQSGKHVLELSAKEHEAVMLYRKYGNESYLDECLDRLRRVRDILRR